MQSLHFPRTNGSVSKRVWLAAGLWLAIGGALVGAFTLPGGSDRDSGAPVASRVSVQLPDSVGPRGVITYTVDGQAFHTVDGQAFHVSPRGTPLDSVPARLAGEPEPSPTGEYVSPDGASVAIVAEEDGGTFLDIRTPHFVGRIAWLAGSESAQLVSAGKAPARAVDGVPLVVAWSPDSRAVAFGSITGAPWVLQVARLDRLPAVDAYELSGGYVGELSWSPDSEHLAISTYAPNRSDHTLLILDRGAPIVRVLSDGCDAVWSPDSRYVAIHREPRIEPGVWVFEVETGENWALTREASAFPAAWVAG